MITEERFQKIMRKAIDPARSLSTANIQNLIDFDDITYRYPAILGDGTSLSIQAGLGIRCIKKSSNSTEYGLWEVAVFDDVPAQFIQYAEEPIILKVGKMVVCNYVPTEVILEVINERGGTLELEILE
jgi:hypothetical protein